jgi:hypothetical protein
VADGIAIASMRHRIASSRHRRQQRHRIMPMPMPQFGLTARRASYYFYVRYYCYVYP